MRAWRLSTTRMKRALPSLFASLQKHPGPPSSAWLKMVDGQALKVAVTAPPDKGRANEAVVTLLSKAFSIAKREVTLISGASDRHKNIRLQGDPKALADIAKNWSPS